MLSNFAYVRPGTLPEAIRLAGQSGAQIHGGGTDLLGALRDRAVEASLVVSLQNIAELRGIVVSADGSLCVGALVTLAEIAGDARIRERWPALADAAAAAASPQLRNQGTIGGNLCQKPRCWYWRGEFPCARKGGDTCFAINGENEFHAIFGGDVCVYVHPSDPAVALVSCDALIRIVGPGGPRVVPVERFFVLPATDHRRETVLEAGEIVTEVVVPAPPVGIAGVYRKARSRAAWDFALAGAAVTLGRRDGVITQARVVLSGVAPTPWRLPAVEQVITGTTLTAEVIHRAATLATKGATPLGGNAMKVPLVGGVVEQALTALV